MNKTLNFDDFLVKKDNHKAFFICLLDDEKPFLENPAHWIHSVQFKIFLVRLSKEEFNMLHIGIHPKVLLYDHGKEIKAWNGIPKYEEFTEAL